jgi:hypothetical protein
MVSAAFLHEGTASLDKRKEPTAVYFFIEMSMGKAQ